MSECTNVSDLLMENGDFCFIGKIRGLGITDGALSVLNTSIKTKEWWDAQKYAASNRVSTILASNFSESTPGEVSEHTPEFGFSINVSETSVKYTMKWQGNLCLRRAFERYNNKQVYVVLFSDQNYIVGMRDTASKLKFAKAMIKVMNEEIDGVDYNVLEITFAKKFQALKKEISMASGFTTEDITGITGIILEFVSCNATTLIVDAFGCNDADLESLDDTKYLVYNITDDPERATALTITLWADSGNRYIATIDAGSAPDDDDVIVTTWDGPAATNEYIIQEEASGVAVVS